MGKHLKLYKCEEIEAKDVPVTHESNYYRLFLDVIKNNNVYIINNATEKFRIALHTANRMFKSKNKVEILSILKKSIVIVGPRGKVFKDAL